MHPPCTSSPCHCYRPSCKRALRHFLRIACARALLDTLPITFSWYVNYAFAAGAS
ncbi:hypothetical protein [Sphingobium sp. SYK-6]|uniref:hypothetical protein n=1 Tax=Sphingobium sp. (strain NBRC 103272 / SYK-6) TaxID=627192 RepID=UPI0011D2B4D7